MEPKLSVSILAEAPRGAMRPKGEDRTYISKSVMSSGQPHQLQETEESQQKWQDESVNVGVIDYSFMIILHPPFLLGFLGLTVSQTCRAISKILSFGLKHFHNAFTASTVWTQNCLSLPSCFLIWNRLECASNLSALDHFLNCDLSRFMQVYCTHVHTIYNIRTSYVYTFTICM